MMMRYNKVMKIYESLAICFLACICSWTLQYLFFSSLSPCVMLSVSYYRLTKFSEHHEALARGIDYWCRKLPLGYKYPHPKSAGGCDSLVIRCLWRILHFVACLQDFTSWSEVSFSVEVSICVAKFAIWVVCHSFHFINFVLIYVSFIVKGAGWRLIRKELKCSSDGDKFWFEICLENSSRSISQVILYPCHGGKLHTYSLSQSWVKTKNLPILTGITHANWSIMKNYSSPN